MTPDRLVLVISDLHMGVPPLDDFDDEVEQHFVRFLDEWCQYAGPVELIINGDLLDFVQAPPFAGADLEDSSPDGVPLCFTEAQSLQKLEAIAAQHAASFRALGRFLGAGDDRHVTILPGNHDADFFWDRVRTAFTAAVCGDDVKAERLRFHRQRVYRPPGHEHLWIEHGHQYDPINRFFVAGHSRWSEDAPPILQSRTGTSRLYECIGTRFMIRYLNRLDRDYPLMDNVKPFGRFLKMFGASTLAADYGPLKVAVVIAAMCRYLAATVATHPKDLLEYRAVSLPDSESPLRTAVEKASPAAVRAFADALTAAGFRHRRAPMVMLQNPDQARELEEFVAQHPEVVDALGKQQIKGAMELGRGFKVDETHDLLLEADRILRESANGCRFVAMGHTHGRHGGDKYFNTGCWTRYYTEHPHQPVHLNRGPLRQPPNPSVWELLEAGSYARFPYSLDVLESRSTPAPAVTMKPFAERHWD